VLALPLLLLAVLLAALAVLVKGVVFSTPVQSPR
jgi:hypothetical protein